MLSGGLEQIGVVIIGRNEGSRLSECLRSVEATGCPFVYVDSGSSDGSAARGRERGAMVVELREGWMTAARGRQAGLDALLEKQPSLGYVQFIDGDCVLDPSWLPVALARLIAEPSLAGVCGRRRESRAAKSAWSRIIDVDWNIPPGNVPYFGGDAMCRVDALRAVGGWDGSLIAGEEPELCFRLRDAGYRIERIDHEQTSHDIAITRFGQYWRRARRGGYASVRVGLLRRSGSGRAFLREGVSALVYGMGLPALCAVLAVFAWPFLVIPVLLYARVFAALWRHARRRGCDRAGAWAYAWMNLATKPAAAHGAISALLDTLVLRRRTALIEYKGPGGRRFAG